MIEIEINENRKIGIEKKGHEFFIDGKKSTLEVEQVGPKSYKVFSDNKIFEAQLIERSESKLELLLQGENVSISISSHMDQVLEKLGMNSSSAQSIKEIKAPMPGTILSIEAKEGDEVAKGETLLILEAMKMENAIKCPGKERVQSILVKPGDNVEKNQSLITFE